MFIGSNHKRTTAALLVRNEKQELPPWEKPKNNPMRLSFFLHLAFLSTAIAGNFNVANLAHEEELTIIVECDKRTQPFTLPAGADSGPFTLPEKEALFRVKEQELAAYKAAAGREGRLILLYRKNEQLTWHTVISKAEKDKTSCVCSISPKASSSSPWTIKPSSSARGRTWNPCLLLHKTSPSRSMGKKADR